MMNQKKRRSRITDAEIKQAYIEASRFVLDIAKLVFAGVILAGIMDMIMEFMVFLSVVGLFGLAIIVWCAYGDYKDSRRVMNADNYTKQN